MRSSSKLLWTLIAVVLVVLAWMVFQSLSPRPGTSAPTSTNSTPAEYDLTTSHTSVLTLDTARATRTPVSTERAAGTVRPDEAAIETEAGAGEWAALTPPGLDQLVAALSSSDRSTVLAAISDLAALGTVPAVNHILSTVAGAAEAEWKHQLMEAAFGITNPAATELLFDQMRGEDVELRELAARSLAAMEGNNALLETVARYRLSVDEKERESLLMVLRYESEGESVPTLCAIADQAQGQYAEPMALAVVDTLGVIGTTSSVQYLFTRLPEAAAAGPLVESISRVSSADNLALLLSVAGNAKLPYGAEGRTAAVRALANYPAEESKAALEGVLRDSTIDEGLRREAENSLARVSSSYTPDFTR